jgi:hypothetical protein
LRCSAAPPSHFAFWDILCLAAETGLTLRKIGGVHP